MLARLSDELISELERAGDEPLRVENPRNHKLYVIIAEDRLPNGDKGATPSGSNGDWTEDKNARRFALIDKQIAGTISTEETAELRHLQQQIDEYLRRVAPLPLTAARDLHEQVRRSLGNSPQP
jgi:hypothetical protein